MLLTVRGEFLVLHSLPGILADAGQQVIPVQVRLLHNNPNDRAQQKQQRAAACFAAIDDGC